MGVSHDEEGGEWNRVQRRPLPSGQWRPPLVGRVGEVTSAGARWVSASTQLGYRHHFRRSNPRKRLHGQAVHSRAWPITDDAIWYDLES